VSLEKRTPRFFVPLAVFMTDEGGEVLIRDYAGQSGRFCVIGPYTRDIMFSARSALEARYYVETRFGPGTWTEGMFS
jgi:hypothetical protein